MRHAVAVESAAEAVHVVERAGGERVGDVPLVAFDAGAGVHHGMQVTLAPQCLLDVAGRGMRQRGTVDDGRLTNVAQYARKALVAPHAVALGEAVDAQRHGQDVEPLCVGLLAEKAAVVGGLDVLVGAPQTHVAQPLLTLAQKLAAAAPRGGDQQDAGQQQGNPHAPCCRQHRQQGAQDGVGNRRRLQGRGKECVEGFLI